MPHIYNVYASYRDLLNDLVTIRLLGGDRKEIEEKMQGKWNVIGYEKKDLNIIVEMIQDLTCVGKTVHVYVNNHYEGSAPLTIQRNTKKKEITVIFADQVMPGITGVELLTKINSMCSNSFLA